VIGGIGGGLGANITREEEWKTYPEVRGEVLENLGIIYDSYKDKSFTYELLMRDPPEEANIQWDKPGSPSALLNVSLKADLVPFWPEGSSRPLDVRVTFLGSDLQDQIGSDQEDQMKVTLKKITIKARTGYDPETGEYEGETKTLRTVELSEVFDTPGEDYHSSIDVKFPEGEKAAGFIVEIEATMVDHWGRAERSPLSGKANPINIRPVDTFKIVRGFGIPLSLPLLITAIILSVIAVVLVFFKKRPFVGLVAPATILSLIAPLWYRSGMNAAVELLGERLSGAESGLHWSMGIILASVGVLLFLTALTFSGISLILTKGKAAEDISASVESGSPRFKRLEGSKGPAPTPTFKRISDEEKSSEGNPRPGRSISPPPPPIDPTS
jgi:hypothetical protein